MGALLWGGRSCGTALVLSVDCHRCHIVIMYPVVFKDSFYSFLGYPPPGGSVVGSGQSFSPGGRWFLADSGPDPGGNIFVIMILAFSAVGNTILSCAGLGQRKARHGPVEVEPRWYLLSGAPRPDAGELELPWAKHGAKPSDPAEVAISFRLVRVVGKVGSRVYPHCR